METFRHADVCSQVTATHKSNSKKTKNKNDAEDVSRSSGARSYSPSPVGPVLNIPVLAPSPSDKLDGMHGLCFDKKRSYHVIPVLPLM
jgi:hypothetical protein